MDTHLSSDMVTVNGHTPAGADVQRRLGSAVAPVRRSYAAVAWVGAVGVIAVVLFAVQDRAHVPPGIAADYNYIFLAADRMFDGHGPTTPPPHAPFQAWQWECDWRFLTQWPLGYPLLLCGIRLVFGMTTAQAGVGISALSCSVALVGWFAWIRRCLPARMPATLIAVLAAASTFTLGNLLHPSTDVVVLALTPLVLLAASRAIDDLGKPGRSGWMRLAAVGLFAGSLVWVRYVAVCVPMAIGVFLILQWVFAKRARLRDVGVFAFSALVPIITLMVLNGALADGATTRQQLNLGDRLSIDFDFAMVATAWRRFTEQTFYDYRPESAMLFVWILPALALITPVLFRDSRRKLSEFLARPEVLLSVTMTGTLLATVILATTLFKEKYDYVSLPRYYQPIRPFYYLFFLGPVLTLRPRVLRGLACVPLILCCLWFVRQDWTRTYLRWQAAAREMTDYGRCAQYFEPHSAELYRWLRAQRRDDLVVFSNFHDDIALETQIPACPAPRTVADMERWIEGIKRAREIDDARVLFVLDPDNHTREYFLPPPEDVIRQFHLVRVTGVPDTVSTYVYALAPADWTSQLAGRLGDNP